MPRSFSTGWQEEVNGLSSSDPPRWLLTVTHADLEDPIRLVQDTADLDSRGETFTAAAFRVAPPDDRDGGLPRASVTFDNTAGSTLAALVEAAGGGKGASVLLEQVRRSAPDTVEWALTLELADVAVTMAEVSGTLGYEDVLNRSAVALSYRPSVAPGLF